MRTAPVFVDLSGEREREREGASERAGVLQLFFIISGAAPSISPTKSLSPASLSLD
jgi:hypothetical protein